MNKIYIKRQITLYKLGFPMDKDIQEYVNYFYKIIGDPNELIKEHAKYFKTLSGYVYLKDGDKIIFYYKEYERFYVDRNIWDNLEKELYLNHSEISELLNPILEEIFNYKVNSVHKDFYDGLNY